MSKKHLLLTGSTGLLGQYLLRDLLIEEVPLAVLIRSYKDLTAEDRLEQVVGYWEEELDRKLPRPVCLEGDIIKPGLGLSNTERGWLSSHCDSVLHNAASLTFAGKDRSKEPWSSNYTGTANVLDLCRETKIRKFHYISTAYVSGQRVGLIREDEFETGQEFRNDYEHCKFEAEKLVRSADFLEAPTVYRPAIIVGDSISGYTTTYHGVYAYMYFAYLYTQIRERGPDGLYHAPIRLNITGEEHRNLVPVDWVSAVTTHIFTRPSLHGKTYHLTPRQATTAREIEATITRCLNLRGLEYCGPEGFATSELNETETMFYEFINQYQPYWKEEPRFDSQRTQSVVPHLPCPFVDTECLARLIEFAVRDQWGKGRKKKNKKAVKNTPYATTIDQANSPVVQAAE